MKTASGNYVATTTGKLRESLIECIGAVRRGNLDQNDARAIALLAREVTGSLDAELRARQIEKDLTKDGVALLGELVIGERDAEAEPQRKLVKPTQPIK